MAKGKKTPNAQNPDANASVRGVEPQAPLEGEVSSKPSEGGSSRGSRNPLGKLISGVQGVGDSAIGAVKRGTIAVMHGKLGFSGAAACAKSAVTKTASFLHIGNKAAALLLAGAVAGGSGTVYFGWADMQARERLIRQEQGVGGDDCAEEIENLKTDGAGTPSGDMAEYAAKAWAVGKLIGLSDEQCAGMIGNMEKESGCDPTTIETIYDEPFNIEGPKKKAAASDLCAFTTTAMRQAYVNSGWGINGHTTAAGCTMAAAGGGNGNIASRWYEGSDGHFFPGIGLFGFTGPEGNALCEYANAAGKDWWDFDLQMAFIIDTTGGYSRAAWLNSWSPAPGSPGEAAHQFNINFEGNSSDFRGDKAAQNAEKWFSQFAGTNGDTAYAQSVLAIADSVAGGQANQYVAEKEEECETAEAEFDNSDLARAAVAYAYETTDMGRGNNGTALYQAVHDAVFPGDPYYQSCDRGVTTAVRWSGSDDNITAGYTDSLDVYFQSCSEHWTKVGEFGSDVQYEDLQPGDILNTTSGRRGTTHGHIVIFVGNEIVREKFPNSAADFVSASYMERSPGCETWTPGRFVGQGYYVYRNTAPEDNPKYTGVVEGQNLSDR